MDASTVISTTKWIGSWLLEEGKFLYGVKDQVHRLQDELECMVGLLEESDQAQQQAVDQEGDKQLVIFTKKIREIAFRAENVVDNYILQVATKSEGRSLLTKGAHFLVNSPLIYLTGNKIDDIIQEAKEANARLNRYRVVGLSTNNTTRSRPVRLETYAHTHDDEIVIGFEDHIQTLVKKVTDAKNKPWVIGIVGTAGAGKTTLARKVFHHPDITCYFKYKAWVSISQQWNRKNILYEILRNTRGINDESERDRNWDERELVEMIYDFLKDKKYLLVIDDIWETKAWDEICEALPRHHKGGKIIITTRMIQVPSYADANYFVLEPRLLNDEESWKLFRKIAIEGKSVNSSDLTKFEKLGKEMVAKCGGLPLAVITLAGLLRPQELLDYWEHINKACGGNILDYGRVDKIIALSYLSLPSNLKPCFLYLGMFPEDVEIGASLLTQLWIAEGLVTEDQLRGQETLEDVAKWCLDELVRRCILQVARRSFAGIAKKFRLHDLLRDFCIAKAKYQNFMEVFSPMEQSALAAKVSSMQARRATFHSGISLPTKNPHLRSLSRYGKSGPYIVGNFDNYEKVRMNMTPVVENFKLLRVLNLWGIETASGELSNEIGNLIHLRFLAMKGTSIKTLPKAIGNLRNLKTLDFRWNRGGGNAAFTLSKMSQIRHLSLGWGYTIATENFGLHKLKDLQTLKGISAGNWMIKEMKGLRKGIKQLELCKMSSMEQLQAVYECPSIMYDSVRTLFLNWLDDEKLMIDLEKLENCQQLQKLTLHGRIIGDNQMSKRIRFPPNIAHLVLWNSHLQRPVWITALGQLRCLKFLHLGPSSFEGAQISVKAGAFHQLEVLSLSKLSNLERWSIQEGALACLKRVTIDFCPKLQRLPQGLRAITTLQRFEALRMPATFCKRLGWKEDDGRRKITIRNSNDINSSDEIVEEGRGRNRRSGEDVHIIQHVPTIEIRNVMEG